MKNKTIKKVLMCRPLYFSTLDYAINPWMKPGSIDNKKTMREWELLVDTYKNLGIDVAIIDQQKGVPDMVFAADQGITHSKHVLLSRFRYKERQPESDYYEKWFMKNGYTVQHLPKGIFFEGHGESYFWKDILFVGTGYRTSEDAGNYLEKFFDREVIRIRSIDPAFFHLDMGFLPLNDETIFYYPPAYAEETIKTLKKRVTNLIEFTKEEAMGFCGNSVITDHHVVYQKGNNTFARKLKNLGYTPISVDLNEFKKSGGGVHCLTNILE